MNAAYVGLGCAVAVVTLLSVVFSVGRKSGRLEAHLEAQDQHLARQDQQITELHNKLDKLQP